VHGQQNIKQFGERTWPIKYLRRQVAFNGNNKVCVLEVKILLYAVVTQQQTWTWAWV
jgi:hypothetical protein